MRRILLAGTLSLIVFGAVAEEPSSPQKAEPAAAKNPQLRQELLRRMETDQKVRLAGVELMTQQAVREDTGFSVKRLAHYAKIGLAASRGFVVDQENTTWLKGIVDERGWPTVSLVGKDGAHAAWLLVQHADADTTFQRRCLDLMTKLPAEEVSMQNVAYLTDRVLVAEGKKQLYGTQFNSVDGKLQPRPIEDEANVDQRRSKVGLPSLAEYAKQMEQFYGGSAKKQSP